MKIGCCVKDASEAKLAEAAGYDFVECSVLSLHPEGEEEAFQQVMHSYKELAIPLEVCNLFLPKDLMVIGEDLDKERINNYVISALNRVKSIGADIIVFGSGYARSIPVGFDNEIAEQQMINFLRLVAKHAEKQGITIVIEPLNKKESNFINSISDAVYFAKIINSPSIKVLADFYHMDEEKELFSEITKFSDYVKHIHLADTGRKQPGTGLYRYDEFSNAVKKSSYDGRVCVEAIWNNFQLEELKKSLNYLKNYFK